MERALAAIDWGIAARAIHVLAAVVWIGGVSLITSVLLPAMKARPPEEWIREFGDVERRFATQVRLAVLLTLASGFWMLFQYDLWDRFLAARYWWMHLMVGVWLLYAVVLFIAEPVVLHRLFHERAAAAPAVTLRFVLRFHRIMLVLSLFAVFAAVAGAHGLF
jgi:uncharacterized membrane protein